MTSIININQYIITLIIDYAFMWNENWMKFHKKKKKKEKEMLGKGIVVRNACLQISYLASSFLGLFGETKLCHIGSTVNE